MSRDTTPTENVVAELRDVAAVRRQASADERNKALFVIAKLSRQDGDLMERAAALIESQRATIERVERERDDLQERFDQLHAAKDIHAEKRHEAEARVTALEAEKAGLVEDAERWRALMSSQRMHMMGSFGFDYVFDPPDSRKHVDLVDVVPRADDYMHFGIEFWSTHAAFGDPAWPDDFPRKLLVTYVDEMRARQALSRSTEKNDG